MKNTIYGDWFPNDCDIGPPNVGPITQPIPKTVSYAPIIFPDIVLLVLLRIISKVKGKNMLNPNPINTSATANMMIESEIAEINNPIETAIVAAINVWLVLFENLPANTSEITLEIPNAKYNNKISVSDIPLSFKNAG